MGQALPEIPLSVGSKLELLRAFVFATFLYTSMYTHAFVHIHICILPCIYMYVHITWQRHRGFCTLVPSLHLIVNDIKQGGF